MGLLLNLVAGMSVKAISSSLVEIDKDGEGLNKIDSPTKIVERTNQDSKHEKNGQQEGNTTTSRLAENLVPKLPGYQEIVPASKESKQENKKEPKAPGEQPNLEEKLKEDIKNLSQANIKAQEAKATFAEKAAKAAIISRNMSHNLGSHVLSYTQSFLLGIAEKINNNEIGHGPLSEADTRGLAHLMHYLQERQDFIASVAMYQVPYFSPVPFKEAVFDCLNPDLISIRHPNTPQITNFLLDNIARSEGYTRYGGHKLSVVYYDEKKKKVLAGNKVGDEGVKELNPLRDKTLFLPGGMVGRQAVMSIIENIIRNAAKHEKHSDNLIIYLQLLEANELKDHISCTSNLNDEDKKHYEHAVDQDVLYYLLISYAAKGEIDKTLETLNKGLKSSYIDYEDNIESSYKGMKEIRVCASWLRGITDEKEYDNQNLSPLVRVHKSKIGDTEVLQYIVGVRKGRKLAIIKDGYDDEFIRLMCAQKDWKTRVYDTAEEYVMAPFSNCAEFTIVSSESIYEDIKENSYRRVVVLNPQELSNGEREQIISSDVNVRAEKFLNIIYARFAGEDVSVINKRIELQDNELKSESIAAKRAIIRSNFSRNCEYAYKRHLEKNNEWNSFVTNLQNGEYKCLKFVESITGDKSTMRLVKQRELDYFWYYEQLHSMKSQVAIIDERFLNTDSLNEKKAIMYKLSGIFLFNIDIESKNSSGNFDIWGLSPMGVYGKEQKVVIGELSVNIEEKSVSFIIDEKYGKQYPQNFDYISIHQGLLDKIYGIIGATSNTKDCVDTMNVVTDALLDGFNKYPTESRLSIHSGRGKIENSKMPQHVPFIQFSALSTALQDCKYSLISLLSYSKYELSK